MHCMSVGVASSVHRAAVTGQFGCTGDTCAVVGVDVDVPLVKAHLLEHGHQCTSVTVSLPSLQRDMAVAKADVAAHSRSGY